MAGAHPLLGRHPDGQRDRFAVGGCQLGGDLVVDSRCNGPRLLPVVGPPGRALGPLSRQRVVQADVRLRRVLLRHEHSHAVRSDPDRASLGRHAAHAARRTITGARSVFLDAGRGLRPARRFWRSSTSQASTSSIGQRRVRPLNASGAGKPCRRTYSLAVRRVTPQRSDRSSIA